MEGKKTKGKQKIEIKVIENDYDKLITFSKRRSGIYKKANELITLAGAEIAFVVFSPAGKAFSFSHPSIDKVAERFLRQPVKPVDWSDSMVHLQRQMRINKLSAVYDDVIENLDVEKETVKTMKEMVKEKAPGWWELPVEDLELVQLMKVAEYYKKLYETVCGKLNEPAYNV